MSSYKNGYLYAAACALDAINALISEAVYTHNITESELSESEYLLVARREHEDRMALLRKVKREVKNHLHGCKP